MKKFSVSTKIFFALLFVSLVFISTKINFSALVGANNQFFTVFQFFGPIAGGILGPAFGILIVFSATFANFAVNLFQGAAFEPLSLLRLLPMLFAVYYFGTKKRSLGLVVPLIAISLFLLHPVGRAAWFYSLFWTIPLITRFFPNRLFLRSLGATFTAHAVGGAIWIWTVPMTPELYIMLLPITAIERLLFASGISLSFVTANTLLAKVESKVPFINVDPRYVLSRYIWKNF
jgi:hypothetical protein